MTTITVRSRGQITLPQKIESTALLKKTAEMERKRGITLEELMAEWDDVRHNS